MESRNKRFLETVKYVFGFEGLDGVCMGPIIKRLFWFSLPIFILILLKGRIQKKETNQKPNSVQAVEVINPVDSTQPFESENETTPKDTVKEADKKIDSNLPKAK